jgi:hypothetical protein
MKMKAKKNRKVHSNFLATLAGNRDSVQDIIDKVNGGPTGTLLGFMPDNYLICMGSISLEPMKRSKVSKNSVSDLKEFF